jgi:GNAT superfamily N-acetyltransferase
VLVASAGLDRVTSEEVRLRSVAVAPERRARGIGRVCLWARFAEVAAARRLVAETDADSCGLYGCASAWEPARPLDGRRARCA